jgi:hypothetical protein
MRWQEFVENNKQHRYVSPPLLDLQRNLQQLNLLTKKWADLYKSQLPLFNICDTSRYSALAVFIKSIQKADIIPYVEAFRKASANLEIKRLQEYFRNLPERTRIALLKLGEHGWYFDSRLSILEIQDLVDALYDGNVEEAENSLIKHFENNINEIEEDISKKFTLRETLIKAAFSAYRRQEYDLAIPVLLAQADGICKETTGKYFFMKEKSCKKQKIARPEIASHVDQMDENSYEAALHCALTKTLPINASTNERTEGFNTLNRHQVLHGESLDYGSKINGLKAISLINYLAWIVPLDSKSP